MTEKEILLVCAAMLTLQASTTETLPNDVRNFIANREGCDHMRGEIPDPPDKQHMKELDSEIRRLCTGTDRKLSQLKRKYATNHVVIKRLGEIELPIEEGKQ